LDGEVGRCGVLELEGGVAVQVVCVGGGVVLDLVQGVVVQGGVGKVVAG
jgi:hypothetical protein